MTYQEERLCAYSPCGVVFRVTSAKKTQQFCGLGCANKARRVRPQSGRPHSNDRPAWKVRRPCANEGCDRQIMPSNKSQRFCNQVCAQQQTWRERRAQKAAAS
jgi:hypothetical protein